MVVTMLQGVLVVLVLAVRLRIVVHCFEEVVNVVKVKWVMDSTSRRWEAGGLGGLRGGMPMTGRRRGEGM